MNQHKYDSYRLQVEILKTLWALNIIALKVLLMIAEFALLPLG